MVYSARVCACVHVHVHVCACARMCVSLCVCTCGGLEVSADMRWLSLSLCTLGFEMESLNESGAHQFS